MVSEEKLGIWEKTGSSDVQDMVSEIRRLRDALVRYGEHDGDCAAAVVGAPADTTCTCGYDAACAAQR